MPVVSKAQARKFFQLYKQGKISKAKLDEWTAGVSVGSLPERKLNKRRKRTKK